MENRALHRLCEFVTPTSAELQALEDAKCERREFRRNQPICRQGDPVKEVYYVAEGWVGGCLEVDWGRNQLSKLYLPGDIAGLPNICLSHAAETLVALTRVKLDTIPLDSLASLFASAPRFGMLLFVVSQQERVMLMDHLAIVGQTNAIQRVAALLLHVYRRLAIISPGSGSLIDWPLSQQRVAEGAGLSAIHVNRTFRELTRRKLIEREGKQIRLLDIERLTELAGLPERAWVKDARWLAGSSEGPARAKRSSDP